jgi:uncharacterized delta-60 repeat protein
VADDAGNGPDCGLGDLGSLDPSYGIDGGAFFLPVDYLTPYVGTGAVLVAVTARPDGRIVALVGVPGTEPSSAPFLVQVLADGSGLDPAFGHGGFLALGEFPFATALQDDGKLLLASVTSSNVTSYAKVTRLLADGSPDPDFGAVVDGGTARSGAALVEVGPGPQFVRIDRLGRLVVAGSDSWSSGSPTRLGVARLTVDGDPDPSFGTGGTLQYTIPGTGALVGFVPQSNGRLVFVYGESKASTVVFATYDNGSPDPTFGATNAARWDGGLGPAFALPWPLTAGYVSIERASNNTITVFGAIGSAPFDPPATQLVVSRLSSSGAIDPAGFVSSQAEGSATATAPVPGGFLVLTNWFAEVARRHADGSSDVCYGTVALPAADRYAALVPHGKGAVAVGLSTASDVEAFVFAKVR